MSGPFAFPREQRCTLTFPSGAAFSALASASVGDTQHHAQPPFDDPQLETTIRPPRDGEPARVLFLSHQYADDGANGLSLRLNNFARHLDRARVEPFHLAVNPHVISSANAAAAFSGVERVTLRPRIRPLPHRVARMLAGSHWFVVLEFPDLASELRRVVAQRRIDLVVDVGGDLIASYCTSDLGVRLATDLVDSRELATRNALAALSSRRARLRKHFELRSIRTFHRACLADAAFVLVTTENDAAAVRGVTPDHKVVTLPNGVDTEHYVPGAGHPGGARVVFEGNMSYRPNVDAALYMANEIWPRVRAARPDAEYWIVGKAPAPEVSALAQRGDGITVTGFVDDVRPLVRQGAVFACTMRMGSGIKNKVLQAWSMQVPVVATTPTLPGLDATPGVNLLVADQPEDFAAAVLRLLADPVEAARIARAGREHVEQNYSWRHRGAQLTGIIGAALAK